MVRGEYMEDAIIVYNPMSGDGQAPKYVDLLKEKLETNEIHTEEYKSKNQEDMVSAAHMACQKAFTYLFVLGGDGSVNDILNGMLGESYKPILGIIPLGTGNIISGNLGFKGSPDSIIDSLNLEERDFIDIGLAGNKAFGYMFSIGEIPKMIQETDRDEKKWLGQLAYAKEILSSGLEFSTYHLLVESNSGRIEGDFSHLIVSNSTHFKDLQFAQGANKPNDGLFNVYLFKAMTNGEMLSLAVDAARGQIQENENVIFFATEALSILTKSEEVPTDMDGDKGPSLPLECKVLPKFVEVLVVKE